MQLDRMDTVGRYEIVGELGAGSMSRVYLAHDPNLDRKVALKIVLQGFSLDNREQSELERRFLLEARAAGKLSHPGIVRVYDADTDLDTRIPYIAMEWVQGLSLRNLLEDHSSLSGPWTLEILAQVAQALDYAHRAGRIHRDIKPSNILIASDGMAKVSDFGVAKIVSESHTISGQVLGTPAYMSPEQVRDEALDGRSDLFSLGAVLYQCVSGVTPFGGDSLVQVVYKILNVDPRPLQLPAAEGWKQLSQIVDRALQKHPDARFQTGSEFAQALLGVRELLTHEPHNDFVWATRRPEPPTGSETVRMHLGDAGAESSGPVPGDTRTVQLHTTEIHHAVAGANRAPSPGGSPWDTISTLPPGAVAGSRRSWRTPLLILLLLVTAVAAARIGHLRARNAGDPQLAPVATSDLNRVTAFESTTSTPPQDPPLPVETPLSTSISELEAPPSAQESEATLEPVAAERIARKDPPPPILTPVTIVYRHKGGLAYLTVMLDGVRVLSQELNPVEGRLQRLTGYPARAVVPVPSGVHTLEVRLSDPQRKVDASKAITSRYTNGRKRLLRVYLDPYDNQMQLRWKE